MDKYLVKYEENAPFGSMIQKRRKTSIFTLEQLEELLAKRDIDVILCKKLEENTVNIAR